MTKYIVRVELHEATTSEYESLYKLMGLIGCYKVMKAGGGDDCHLPGDEYGYEGTLVKGRIHKMVLDVANKVNGNPSVFVTELPN